MEMTIVLIVLITIVVVFGILCQRAVTCHVYRTKKNRRAGDDSFTGQGRRRTDRGTQPRSK